MQISIVLNREDKTLAVMWPNGETHTYTVYDCNAVDHEIRDALADTMTDLASRKLMACYMPTVVSNSAYAPAMGIWHGPAMGYPAILQYRPPGDIAVGPGDIAVAVQGRKPIAILQAMQLEQMVDRWIVTFDDGSQETITSQCSARAYAEEIYCAKPKKD